MKRLLLTVVSMLSIATVVGCASAPSDGNSLVLAQIDDIATGTFQTRPVVKEVNGQPVILYSTKGDRVVLRTGAQLLQLDETARVKQGGGYFQLNKQGQNLQALWWSHQDGKNIYQTASTDVGKNFAHVRMVIDEHDLLPPFS